MKLGHVFKNNGLNGIVEHTIGVLFNIDELEDDFYSGSAFKIFF